jgi:HSP20 family molecular chaperone IbpA
MNILESDDLISIITALPGVKRDSVEITLEDNLLTITGERPLPACCTKGSLKMWEIPLGRFERRLRVGEGRGPLRIAHYALREGLLTIELRKNL